MRYFEGSTGSGTWPPRRCRGNGKPKPANNQLQKRERTLGTQGQSLFSTVTEPPRGQLASWPPGPAQTLATAKPCGRRVRWPTGSPRWPVGHLTRPPPPGPPSSPNPPDGLSEVTEKP